MIVTGLKQICEHAMKRGVSMDLSDCHYGETTGACSFLKRPTNYYFFLAGFVRVERLSSILEVGTNSGGSIMSVSKGLDPRDIATSRIVTVDIIRKNDEGFSRYPNITRIDGDSLDEKVVTKIIGAFDKEIGLLYIDSLHEYEHTKKNMDIYVGKLNPRYVILDDIRQCEDMRKLWGELKEKFGDNAFDASEITIRKGAGFGVIRLRK